MCVILQFNEFKRKYKSVLDQIRIGIIQHSSVSKKKQEELRERKIHNNRILQYMKRR